MNIKPINYDMCNCVCHDDGVEVMHCFPCCNYTYQKRSQHIKENPDETSSNDDTD